MVTEFVSAQLHKLHDAQKSRRNEVRNDNKRKDCKNYKGYYRTARNGLPSINHPLFCERWDYCRTFGAPSINFVPGNRSVIRISIIVLHTILEKQRPCMAAKARFYSDFCRVSGSGSLWADHACLLQFDADLLYLFYLCSYPDPI